MNTEPMHGYKLHLHELGLHPDCNMAGDVLMATGPKATVMVPVRAYAKVLTEAVSESMPSHGSQDLAIELLNGNQLP
jgi:hypothetical protein